VIAMRCLPQESEMRRAFLDGVEVKRDAFGRPSWRTDMAKAVQKITLSRSLDVPFNKPVLSQSNVRRVKARVSIEQLAESIAQRTLRQSPNVRAFLEADANETACPRCRPAGDAIAPSSSW
jgi:ParB family chromosome partitioning protein